jgi:hypothetical protein
MGIPVPFSLCRLQAMFMSWKKIQQDFSYDSLYSSFEAWLRVEPLHLQSVRNPRRQLQETSGKENHKTQRTCFDLSTILHNRKNLLVPQ